MLGGNFNLYNKTFKTHLGTTPSIKAEDKFYDKPSKEKLKYYNDAFQPYCFEGVDANLPKVRVLGVNASKRGRKKDKNIDSMIIKVAQKHSMIIPGDAEGPTWEDVGEANELLADILLVSHHGSMTNNSTSKAVLALIKPKICLITAGFQHDHPTSSTIKMLLDYYAATAYRTESHFVTFYEGGWESIITNAPIFSTIDNGILTVDLLSDSLTVATTRSFEPTPDFFWEGQRGGKTFFLSPILTKGKNFLMEKLKRELALEKFPKQKFFPLAKKLPAMESKKSKNDKISNAISLVKTAVEEIYCTPDGEKQYYKLGQIYLELTWLETEEGKEDMVPVQRLRSWFELHTNIYENFLQCEEVRRLSEAES